MPQHLVWTGNGHTILYVPFNYADQLLIERWWDATTVHAFFAKHWSSSLWLALIYIATVNVLQRVMEHRKPLSFGVPFPLPIYSDFTLKFNHVLFVWNLMLAIFSTLGAWRFGIEFFHVITQRSLKDSVCYSVDPKGPAAFWACMFAFSKIAEFGDTLFLVLKKRPVIFLHWYHHAVVLVYSWHSAVELTAAGRWFIEMNYLVHAIMYSYYAITSLGYRLPKAISMTVTALQTTQMLVGVCLSVAVLYLKLQGEVCQQSFDNLAICFAIYASFLLLFSSFFIKAYLTKKTSKSVKKE